MKYLSIVTLVLIAAVPSVRAEEPHHNHARIRRALEQRTPRLVLPALTPSVVAKPRASRQGSARGPSADSVWEGLLIGGAIGGVGGYIWARQICGTDDTECFVISAPVGILGGAGIGALVGAVADKLHR